MQRLEWHYRVRSNVVNNETKCSRVKSVLRHCHFKSQVFRRLWKDRSDGISLLSVMYGWVEITKQVKNKIEVVTIV